MTSHPGPRVVLLTGCSTGIGLATAVAFAEAGSWATVATMRKPADAPPILTNLPGVEVLALDVTSAASIGAVVDHLVAHHGGRVDVVVNNAGYGVPGSIETVPLDVAQAVFDVNVWGSVRMLRAVLPLMRTRGAGVVVQVSSTSGARGIPLSDVYSGSKFAIEGIVESLRYAVAPDGISVVVVSPGPVRTAFTDRYVPDAWVGGSAAPVAAPAAVGGAPSPPPPPPPAKGPPPVPAAAAAAAAAAAPAAPAAASLAVHDGLERSRRLTARYVEILGERMQLADAQAAEEVATVILKVAEERLGGDPMGGTFRVGTCAAAEAVLATVRRDVDGRSGPVYEAMWDKLGKEVRRVDAEMKAEGGRG